MRPKAVICGSYRRNPAVLLRLFRELEATGCRVISPLSLDFDIASKFVRAPSEMDMSAHDIETFHLRAIHEADFIFLHSPDGYIGISGAYELGYAGALKKPVFCIELPRDEMLAERVKKVSSVFDALETISS